MAQIDAELTFRPFDEKDFEPLAELVGRTWLSEFPARAQEAAIECKRVGLAVMGLEVPHAHIHLIPITRESDMYFDKGKLSPSQEELADIAQRIRERFQ